MSSPKTPKTPQRRRLSLKEKIKIIEDSKKPGFDKAKVMKEYGISRPTIINILKNQFDTLKAVDSGTMNDKSKSLKKSPLAELEPQLQGVPSIGTHFQFQFLTFLMVLWKKANSAILTRLV